jgi:hypothetical protein
MLHIQTNPPAGASDKATPQSIAQPIGDHHIWGTLGARTMTAIPYWEVQAIQLICKQL